MLEAAGLILNVLLAAFKAVPLLKELFDRLLVMYLQKEAEKLKEEIRLGIYNAVAQKDQRGLEEAIGNTNAGKPVETTMN
jgi:hypothetical protein